jgi:pimeloyl-ACP methyl ester carboxylesterase
VVADDGVELYVEVAGTRKALLTVIFCHGLALDKDCWRRQRTAFADQARLIFYDQRGHGRSGRGAPKTATIAQFGRDLYRILEEVVPTGPVVLVGHSMGGMTIMALAETHPDLFHGRVAGVALLSSSAGGLRQVTLGLPACGARALHPIVPGLLRMLGGKRRLAEYGRRAVSDLLCLLVRWHSAASKTPSPVFDLMAGMINTSTIQTIANFYPSLAQHHRFDALPTLRDVPTMILVGENDIVTPVEHSKAIVCTLPSAEMVVFPRTGHSLMLEEPHRVNFSLRKLLANAASMVAQTA